ncbi:MAG: 4-diphosphocytidyl-2C-methyl-D-erythritol synthase [Marmoricola sp.]|nr:4-diphosphocytidyl-2C-methyl-D-erythritol synthase [Marmoricola sp.]
MNTHPARVAIVLLAAGAGSRVGAEVNKVLLPLDGIPVLAHSIRTALTVPDLHRLLVVVRPEDRYAVSAAIAPHLGTHDLWLVDGGPERHDSEYRALEVLRGDIDAGEIDVVALHDAARPLATEALFARVIETAARHGAAVPVVPTGQLNQTDGSLARPGLGAVQTPQAFSAGALLLAYDAAAADGFGGTDTAASLERYTDLAVQAVRGERANLKVTYPEDLALAEQLLTPASD